MQRRAFALSLLASTVTVRARAQPRSMSDSVGRVVEVPGKLARVMPAGPPASILLYSVAPELELGWVPGLQNEAKPYLLPNSRELPALPRLTSRNQIVDTEAIKALRPDLIVDFGSVSPNYVTLADKVKDATGIPTALVDGKFEKMPASLKLIGTMLGKRERGAALAEWASKTIAMADEAIAKAPEGKRPRVYVARGSDGLQTGARGSALTETIERAGAINVAEGKDRRPFDATREQIAAWRPNLILAYDKSAYDAMRKAMPTIKVLLAPEYPWSWLGEPPSLQCLMGLRYLMGVFYRNETKGDLAAATRDFYRLFYGVEPNETQLSDLLRNAA